MKERHFLILLFIFASNCSVGPEYKKPEINTPEKFLSYDIIQSLNIGKSDAEISAAWWIGFNDNILNEIVALGLENNFDIASSMARVKEAEARVKLFSSDLIIDGNINAISQNNENLADNLSTNSNRENVSIDFTLPIDIFGSRRKQVEAALAGLEAARADLQNNILFISSNIVSEYLLLRGNQRQLELLRESVALQEKTLTIVKSRYEAGLSPELDLRRAETSNANLRAAIPPLEEDLFNSRNRIAILTGNFPGAYDNMLMQIKEIPTYDRMIPQMIPSMLSLRPDIIKAEAELKQAIANIGVAKADYYPKFQLGGSLNFSSSSFDNFEATEILANSISAAINQIFLSGIRDANYKIAKAQAESKLAIYEKVLREAIEEVEKSLAAIRSSKERQVSLEKAVIASQRSFSQAETLYQQGLISFLDVVDAQRVLANAEQALAREQTNYATQIAVFFRAIGNHDKSS